MNSISHAKDELMTPDEMALEAGGDYNAKRIANVYAEYQKTLKLNNALDFDDLIFKTVELFEKDAEVLNYYQERFKYIMVDEYQDTNTSQFKLISMLAQKYGNLCVVGDDDQSIYKFRGANIQNILGFEKTFPDATCNNPIVPPPITTTSSPNLISVRLILLITHATGSVNAIFSNGVSLAYTNRSSAFATTNSPNPPYPDNPSGL